VRDPCQPITTIKHPALRRARSLQTAAGRAQARQLLIEGEGMLRQAAAAHAGLTDVFFLDSVKVDESLSSALAAAGAACYSISRGLMTKIVGTGYDTSVTAVAVAPMRLANVDALPRLGGPLLACDCIQDPRNVGVLVRTAEAGGARGMLLSADSADPFSRAAVRSSTGSILRVPLALSSDLPTDLKRLRDAGLRLITTSAHGATPVSRARLDRRCVIIVGNEAQGTSPAARELADAVVAIPVGGGASSFNVTVAAGILLYECLRGERERA
jgi:tRNA G18 (ribose-2'-O)-methylase SpoU